jgi:arylsulfatase A-like enzyme
MVSPALRDGNRYPRGSRAYAPVELLDLMPTLYDMAELDINVQIGYKSWQGMSLIPILQDPANGFVKQAAASQYFRGRGSSKLWGYSVRTTRYRYTNWGSGYSEELYDYLTDSWETTSLSSNSDLKNSLISFAYYNAKFDSGKKKMPFDFDDRVSMSQTQPLLYP